MALVNKDDHKGIYKEIFDKIIKEKFEEIKELTNEINHDYLTYYFKDDTVKKRFDDFNKVIKNFKKTQSGEIKLEEAKKQQNIFKSNLNEISRERFKSEEKKNGIKKY